MNKFCKSLTYFIFLSIYDSKSILELITIELHLFWDEIYIWGPVLFEVLLD